LLDIPGAYPAIFPRGILDGMHIAALQMDIVWHDRQANFTKAHALACAAVEQGARLLVLPEMFATGFSMDTAVTAEPLEGPTPCFLRSLARELDVAVLAGFVLQQSGSNPSNVAIAIDRHGNDCSLYAKMNLIGLMDEERHYAPGLRPVPFEIEGLTAASFICYDLRFPEIFLPIAAQCQLLCVIASWPAQRHAHWEALLRARAIENQAFVLGVNRVGAGGGSRFAGGSSIIDPLGSVIAQAGADEQILLADIDPAVVLQTRRQMPFLNDRKRYLACGKP
jgi:predicted amidohydrolase